MTLQEKIMTLSEITSESIQKNFTFEDYKFDILETINNNQIDYNKLINLFIEVDKFMDSYGFYNIFTEKIALKLFYLYLGYNVDFEVLNSMLLLEPIILLDKRLDEEIFKNNEDFEYFKDAFKEHKFNNGLTLATIMKYMNTLDINPMLDEFKKSIGDLNNIAQK